MSKRVTKIRVYFAGDTDVHRCTEFNGATEFFVSPDTGALYVRAAGEDIAVFQRSEWKHAEAFRSCDSCNS